MTVLTATLPSSAPQTGTDALRIGIDPVLWERKDNFDKIKWIFESASLLHQSGVDCKIVIDPNLVANKTHLLFPHMIEAAAYGRHGSRINRLLASAQAEDLLEYLPVRDENTGINGIIHAVADKILSVTGSVPLDKQAFLTKLMAASEYKHKSPEPTHRLHRKNAQRKWDHEALKGAFELIKEDVGAAGHSTADGMVELYTQIEGLLKALKPAPFKNKSDTPSEEKSPSFSVEAISKDISTLNGKVSLPLPLGDLANHPNAHHLTPGLIQLVMENNYNGLWERDAAGKKIESTKPSTDDLLDVAQRTMAKGLTELQRTENAQLLLATAKESHFADLMQWTFIEVDNGNNGEDNLIALQRELSDRLKASAQMISDEIFTNKVNELLDRMGQKKTTNTSHTAQPADGYIKVKFNRQDLERMKQALTASIAQCQDIKGLEATVGDMRQRLKRVELRLKPETPIKEGAIPDTSGEPLAPQIIPPTAVPDLTLLDKNTAHTVNHIMAYEGGVMRPSAPQPEDADMNGTTPRNGSVYDSAKENIQGGVLATIALTGNQSEIFLVLPKKREITLIKYASAIASLTALQDVTHHVSLDRAHSRTRKNVVYLKINKQIAQSLADKVGLPWLGRNSPTVEGEAEDLLQKTAGASFKGRG